MVIETTTKHDLISIQFNIVSMVNYIVKDLNNFLEYFEILVHVPEGKYLEGFVNTRIYS